MKGLKVRDVLLVNRPVVKPANDVYFQNFRLPASIRHKALMFTFKNLRWHDNVANVANPLADDFIVHFQAGEGAKREGLRTACEYFVMDDHLYRRLSWGDVGIEGRQNGLRVQVNSQLIYLVVEETMTEVVKAAIGNAI